MASPRLVNVKKEQLQLHYVDVKSFAAWLKRSASVYIGRNVRWVPETFDSPWGNYLRLDHDAYIKYILEKKPFLLTALGSLEGKDIGCWCVHRPERLDQSVHTAYCHGQAIQTLYREHVERGQTQEDLCGKYGANFVPM